jgi:hypothetical protein
MARKTASDEQVQIVLTASFLEQTLCGKTFSAVAEVVIIFHLPSPEPGVL